MQRGRLRGCTANPEWKQRARISQQFTQEPLSRRAACQEIPAERNYTGIEERNFRLRVRTQRSLGNKVADVGFKVMEYMLIAYKVNPGGPNRLI